MRSLIQFLHTESKSNLLKEKILLVDSYTIGEQILIQYTKQGYHAVNLKIKTIRDLAIETVGNIDEYLNSTIGAQLVYTLLTALKKENKLKYFHELEVTPSFSHGVYEMIQELRLAGYTSNTIKKEYFVTEEKGHDMILIFSQYEKLLMENKLKDDGDLYRNAYRENQQFANIFFLQCNLSLTKLQEQFLEKILPDNHFYLPMAPVYGVPTPKESKFSKTVVGEETLLSFIYQLDRVRNRPTNMKLFSAKTEEMELKEIVEKIKENRLRFDHCAILYTQGNPYITTMYHLSEASGLPVTFSDGIPVSFTRPGKLLQGLLQWMKESYNVQTFFTLLEDGILDIGKDGPSKTRWMTLLRQAKIGWGQERYLSMLEKESKRAEEKRDNETDEQKRLYYSQLNQDYLWLLKWFKAVFKHMPAVQLGSNIVYKELLLGLKHMFQDCSIVHSTYDQAAKEGLIEKIDRILPYANDEGSIYDMMFKIEELLLSINVSASRPKPGHLHLTSYKESMFLNRDNLFIVGLDNHRFPGTNGENPLLLDIERNRLGNMIPLLKESTMLNQYRLLQVLASSIGQITLSYCQFDVNENRAVSPAHLFLQCYRFQSGNKDADFKALKQELPVIEETLIDQKDWWSQKLVSPVTKELDLPILQQFSNIIRGLESEETRTSSSFTVYEGKIESDTSEYDPRINLDITITAGKLEMLAACPYSFFLQEILGLKPVEEIGYDSNRWLDAATRGSVLHEIFEKFYLTIQERGEKPSVARHQSLIKDLALNILGDLKQQIPVPNKKVELQETAEILESCETFLKIEEETSGKPTYFEYTFGVGETTPAMIQLPSGAFNLAGKIDRVDQLSEESYHIIDYKTGSTWSYDHNAFFKGGRHLQHFLYTLAIENHLSLKEGTVQKSSYLFPTKKGLGQAFERVQEVTTRENGRDILEKLLNIIRHGDFTMTDDENDCKYCNFSSICKRSVYDKEVLDVKHQDPTAIGVRSFKGVRSYV